MTDEERRLAVLDLIAAAVEAGLIGPTESAELAAWVRCVSVEDGQPRLRAETETLLAKARKPFAALFEELGPTSLVDICAHQNGADAESWRRRFQAALSRALG